MAEHWGLAAIARRMGVCETTVVNWRLRYGFLMFRRRRGPRWHWYTNDSLIHTWEVARCATELKLDRERVAYSPGAASRLRRWGVIERPQGTLTAPTNAAPTRETPAHLPTEPATDERLTLDTRPNARG